MRGSPRCCNILVILVPVELLGPACNRTAVSKGFDALRNRRVELLLAFLKGVL